MAKSKLNQMCQKFSWGTPNYSVTQIGPDHAPIFQASVEVNDCWNCKTPGYYPTSKQAQKVAASIAVYRITVDLMKTDSTLKVFNMLGEGLGELDALLNEMDDKLRIIRMTADALRKWEQDNVAGGEQDNVAGGEAQVDMDAEAN